MPQAEQALRLVASGLTEAQQARQNASKAAEAASEKAFLQTLAGALSRALEADYVVVGQTDPEIETVTTLAVSAGGQEAQPFSYPLEGTPCATVVHQQVRTFPEGVRRLFPTSTTMESLAIEGYVGIPLWDLRGEPLGLMAVLYCRPVPDVELAESLLRIVAAQVSAEIERFVATAQKRLSDSRFETALKSTPIQVFNQDRELRYTWVHNPFWGLDAEDLIGRTDFELMQRSQDAAEMERIKNRVLETGQGVRHEMAFVHADEEYFFDLTIEPLRDPAGQVTGITAAVVDVTERKKAEEALRRAHDELDARVVERTRELQAANDTLRQRETQLDQARRKAEEASRVKSQFLANMSHEIRTPVSAVIGLTQLLCKAELAPTEREYVEVLSSTADGLLHLIDDILDFSKIEAEKLSLELSDFEPRQLLEDVAKLFQAQVRSRGLDLRIEVPPELRRNFRGDPARLRQVLINLVGNAVKFTQDGSVILRVAAQPGDSQRLRFEVHDSGIGIEPEVRAGLFRPFVQADSSTTRRFGGTGLGLAISKRVIEMMGGEIGVESEPGYGSEFFFNLPMEPCAASAEVGPAKPSKAFEVEDPGRYLLLLAEDNPANRLIAVRLLESLGYRVDAVENGRQALEALSCETYDLVFMDCQMPELDGFEATRQLRRRESGCRTPVVALTANAFRGDRDRCLDAGMDDYISKPFREEDIAGVLSRFLSRGASRPGEPGQDADVRRS